MAIELTITAPPSTNNLFVNGARGRHRSPAYKSWQQTAGWEMQAQAYRATAPKMSLNRAKIEGPFALTIWLPPGVDLDNGVKAVADLLGPGKHGMGITEDDRQMVELHVFRDGQAKQCRVRIEART